MTKVEHLITAAALVATVAGVTFSTRATVGASTRPQPLSACVGNQVVAQGQAWSNGPGSIVYSPGHAAEPFTVTTAFGCAAESLEGEPTIGLPVTARITEGERFVHLVGATTKTQGATGLATFHLLTSGDGAWAVTLSTHYPPADAVCGVVDCAVVVRGAAVDPGGAPKSAGSKLPTQCAPYGGVINDPALVSPVLGPPKRDGIATIAYNCTPTLAVGTGPDADGGEGGAVGALVIARVTSGKSVVRIVSATHLRQGGARGTAAFRVEPLRPGRFTVTFTTTNAGMVHVCLNAHPANPGCAFAWNGTVAR